MQQKSTLNIEEVAKFSKIAAHWWQIDGKYKLLHDIAPIRLQFIKTMIAEFVIPYSKEKAAVAERINLDNLNILDVGCGGGLISIPLAKHGARVTSLDASSENIEVARSMAETYELDICFVHDTIENYSKTNNKYDLVLALEIIEHVDNIDYFVENLADNLNDNGILIVSTINRSLNSYIYTKLIAEYILNWLDKGTHEFKKYIKPAELYNIAVKSNLTLLNQTGLKYNILNNCWYLDQNIDTNYFAVFKKHLIQ